jgi:hypothetical protein
MKTMKRKTRTEEHESQTKAPKDFKTIGQLTAHLFPGERTLKIRLRGTARHHGSKAANESLERLAHSLRP